MVATSAKVPVTVDPWETEKTSWEYVSIPAENAIGEVHADLSLSGPHTYRLFEHGKTYLVPKPVAETITERLRAYMASRVRVYSPSRDMKSVYEQARSGVGSAQVAQATSGGATELQAVQPPV